MVIKKVSLGIILSVFFCTTSFATHNVIKKLHDTGNHEQNHNVNKLTISIEDGTLRGNIEKIADENGWNNVVWKLPYDYQVLGGYEISGRDVPDVFSQLLKPLPVKAIFYKRNKTIVIIARGVLL